MKQKKKKQLTHWLSVIVIGIALGFALQFVRAWTEPTDAPPGGNVGAPINTGAQMQTKAGGFNVMGSFGLGTENPANKLDVFGKIKATGDICTTATGPEICLSTAGGGGGGGGGTPSSSCPLCGTCNENTTLIFNCWDGFEGYWKINQTQICTTSGWICTSCCGGCGSSPYTCS